MVCTSYCIALITFGLLEFGRIGSLVDSPARLGVVQREVGGMPFSHTHNSPPPACPSTVTSRYQHYHLLWHLGVNTIIYCDISVSPPPPQLRPKSILLSTVTSRCHRPHVAWPNLILLPFIITPCVPLTPAMHDWELCNCATSVCQGMWAQPLQVSNHD